MTWEHFFERFFDLSQSTQKSYSYKLTDYGPADEVFEVLSEFAFCDKKLANRFASKALDYGVRFTPEHTLDMATLIDKSVLSRMAETAVPAFDRNQLDEIYTLIDDDAFERISREQNIDIFADEELDEYEPEEEIAPQPKRHGFFSALFGAIAVNTALENSRKKRHNGRCNGDCANCPPHYGYRYGRWYYGHSHQYGCEYNGNRGDGGWD